MRFKVQAQGQEWEIEVRRQGDRLLLARGDERREARLVQIAGASFVLELAENGPEGEERLRLVPAAGVVLDASRRQLWANGTFLAYERLPEHAPGATDAGSDASLSASIPAVVAEILVQVGDSVAAGDKLLLLESMKMVIPIQAPYPGLVKALHCAPGQAVQPGVPLVELAREGQTEGA